MSSGSTTPDEVPARRTAAHPEIEEVERGIGAAVEILRIRSGLSRDELATRGQLSRSAVLKIEKGERTPSAQTLKKLADGLGVTTDELLITSWVTAEDDPDKRRERARLTSTVFAAAPPAARVGAAVAGTLIAAAGAPIWLGAAAGVTAGRVVHGRQRRHKQEADDARLRAEVQRRIEGADREMLEALLNALPPVDPPGTT